MVRLEDWDGLVGADRPVTFEKTVQAVLPQLTASGGGSQPALVRASDGARYWVKPRVNGQGSERVPITERIVARVGALIGAPVCEATVLLVPEDLDGEPSFVGSHSRLTAGPEHASPDVAAAKMLRTMDHRLEDDNEHRHPFAFALHDWCWGDDPQWLYDAADQHRVFSHDHGYFLPETGPNWAVADLVRRADEAHVLGFAANDLDGATFRGVADRLEAVSREDLARALNDIPRAWAVSDPELCAVGWFLEHRAPTVATRLRAMV